MTQPVPSHQARPLRWAAALVATAVLVPVGLAAPAVGQESESGGGEPTPAAENESGNPESENPETTRAPETDASGNSGSSGSGNLAPPAPTASKADIAAYEAAQKSLRKAQARYAKAVSNHAVSLKRVKKMRKKTDAAIELATATQRDLGNLARLAYTSGNTDLSFLAGLVDATSPQDLMSRASTAERLTNHQSVEASEAADALAAARSMKEKTNNFFDEAEAELAAAKEELKQTKILADSLDLETKFSIGGKPVDLKTKSEWVFPVPGAKIGSEAGMRLHPILGYARCHAGADISADGGTAIHAVDDGVVIQAGVNGGYGNYTVIGHGRGLTSAYAHQSSILVEVGDPVKRGDVIGAVGTTGLSTGDHLHFEARYFGDPYNPRGWLDDKPKLRTPAC
ncbi:MAG: M23 family metallopeptidase [Actinomycetia bacterium]|nr:M23 family metallopeptidase [Actinomycetes bacterium]